MMKRRNRWLKWGSLGLSFALTGCAQTTLRQPASVASPSYSRCTAKLAGSFSLSSEDDASLASHLSRDLNLAPVFTAGHLRLIDLRTMKEVENYDISALTPPDVGDHSESGFDYSDLSWSPSGSYLLVSSNRLDEDRQVLVDRTNKKVTLLPTSGNAWMEQQDTLIEEIGPKSISFLDAASLASSTYPTPGRPGGRILNYPPHSLRDNLTIVQDTPKPRAIIYSIEKKSVVERYQFPKQGSVVSLNYYSNYAIFAQSFSLSVIRLSDMKTLSVVKGGPSIKVSALELQGEVILSSHLAGTTNRNGASFTASHIDLTSWKTRTDREPHIEWSFTPVSVPASQGNYIEVKTDVTSEKATVSELRASGEPVLFTENGARELAYPSLEPFLQSSWLRINGPSADQIGLMDSQNPGQIYYYSIPDVAQGAGSNGAWFAQPGLVVQSDAAMRLYTLQNQGCTADGFHF